jgi:hypothetical protein
MYVIFPQPIIHYATAKNSQQLQFSAFASFNRAGSGGNGLRDAVGEHCTFDKPKQVGIFRKLVSALKCPMHRIAYLWL